MKNIALRLTLSLLFAASFSPWAMGQDKNAARLLFMDVNERWGKYCGKDSVDMTLVNKYFRDTVSVEELKLAFEKYKDASAAKHVFSEYDSVIHCPIGTGIVLRSPLCDKRKKKSESLRNVWAWFGHFALADVHDSKGKPQEKIRETWRKEKLQGDFVSMKGPRKYMGYTVSPLVYAERYENGKPIKRSGFRNGHADFFSYAQRTKQVFDGEWYDYVSDGSRLLGLLVSINTSMSSAQQERTFPVLLYERHGGYSLELLTNNPDEHTANGFNKLKRVVADLPPRAIKPYYTSDFRVLPGRFYQVTVNADGIFIKDYL